MKIKEVKEEIKDIENPNETKNKKPWYKRWYIIMAIITVIVVSIFNYNYTFVMVNGYSMEPNYHDTNLLLGEKHFDYLNRFDVVIINSVEGNTVLIKRVIGLPGETIQYKDNQLFVNGKYVEDIYGTGWTENFTITLDANSYFCMGDNREHSYDSRYYGDFDEKEIMAKIRGRRYVSIFNTKSPLTE